MRDILIHDIPLTIILALFLGYIVGKIKIKSFSIGSTSGIICVAMLIGSLGEFDIPLELANIFLDVAIFIIGYEAGPEFIKVLKKSGVKMAILMMSFCCIVILLYFTCFEIFNINKVTATGLISGSLTETAILELSQEMLNNSMLTMSERNNIMFQINSTYALTYILGTLGVTIVLKDIAPKICGVVLKEEKSETLNRNESNIISGNKENKGDMIFITLGIVISLILGFFYISINGISITISNAGDMALIGLLFGWYRSRRLKKEPIPEEIRWIFKNLGINVFLCIIGLRIGNEFLPALNAIGIKVALLGFILPVIACILTIYFGRYILKLRLLEILGTISGISTVTAALYEITEENDSIELKACYSIMYIIGCIFLNSLGQIALLLPTTQFIVKVF